MSPIGVVEHGINFGIGLIKLIGRGETSKPQLRQLKVTPKGKERHKYVRLVYHPFTGLCSKLGLGSLKFNKLGGEIDVFYVRQSGQNT